LELLASLASQFVVVKFGGLVVKGAKLRSLSGIGGSIAFDAGRDLTPILKSWCSEYWWIEMYLLS